MGQIGDRRQPETTTTDLSQRGRSRMDITFRSNTPLGSPSGWAPLHSGTIPLRHLDSSSFSMVFWWWLGVGCFSCSSSTPRQRCVTQPVTISTLHGGYGLRLTHKSSMPFLPSQGSASHHGVSEISTTYCSIDFFATRWDCVD